MAIISNKSSIYDNIIATSTGSGGGTDPADQIRITNLENNESKILYYEAINSTTGTITKPTNTTIFLNDFPQGYDAVVETIVNGEPTGQIAKTSGGTPITVSSFDTSGNYTLSSTPSSFPIALLYVLRVKALYMSNLTFDNIIEAQNFSIGNASDVVFTPNGDIAATDVQTAIQEVRDDTDTKLTLKLAKASNLSDLTNIGTARTNLGLGGAAVLNVGTTAGTVTAGDDNRIKGYQIVNACTASNLADSITYYIGAVYTLAATFSLPSNGKRIYINKAGTITSAQIVIINGSVDGSTENSSFYLRMNDTTDYLLSSTVQFSATPKIYNITGLSIPVVAGDYEVTKIITPTWVTNPTQSYIQVIYYIE